MKESDHSSRFQAARQIALDAGALALRRFQDRAGLAVESKGTFDFVSDADREVEAFIRERLQASFPDDRFLGEESGLSPAGDAKGCVWVVDPIDGTDCFVNGIPVWSISIALVAGEAIEIGVVYDPNSRELFAARRGHGATLNGGRISVSAATDVSVGIVGLGISHRVASEPSLRIMGRLLARGGMYQRNGSGALMLAYVAAGRCIAYHEAHINAWDALAGLALVREAGGWTSDFLANDGLLDGNAVLACAPGVLAQMREICRLD